MCRPARLKLRASGIQRSTDPAGGYVEACDLDIIGDENPSSQQMYCQCLMLTRIQFALHLQSVFSRATCTETKGYS